MLVMNSGLYPERKQCLPIGETQHFWQHMAAECFAFYPYLYSSLKIRSDKQFRHLQTTEHDLSARIVLGEWTAMAAKMGKSIHRPER